MLIIEIVGLLKKIADDASPEVRTILEKAIADLHELWKQRVAEMGGGQ